MAAVGREALLERDPQFQALLGALDRVAADDGSTVIVSGVAGIGKTSLLSVVADEARRRGFGVLSARGATSSARLRLASCDPCSSRRCGAHLTWSAPGS